MISKELAQEVVGYVGGIFSVEVDDFNGDILIYDNATERRRFNIYELAHKCKEWAYVLGYELVVKRTKVYVYLSSGLRAGQRVAQFIGDKDSVYSNKLEFKACEWIRTQNATNN